jgi:ABC-type transporter Mla subunit MlaD
MSLKANYFKLGLFVIGAIVAGMVVLVIIGSGRWFQPKLTIETYFNESVQGLDIGSKLKYRGVAIGDVTRIGFSYNKYQLDRPVTQRVRYVLVEAQIQPKLLGGRAVTGDLTEPANAKMEVEKGLRIRLAPQGITGTSYLEIDYVDPPPPLLAIDWTPDNIYVPSSPSTVTQLVAGASDVLETLRKLDLQTTLANLNKLLVTANSRIEAVDAAKISVGTTRVLSKLETKLDQLPMDKIGNDTAALIAELRTTTQRLSTVLDDPAWKKLPGDADAAAVQFRKLVEDPNFTKSLAHLQSTLARLDRVMGGGENDLKRTLDNLRQVTENLREITENAKQYPSQLILGAPPPPVKGSRP